MILFTIFFNKIVPLNIDLILYNHNLWHNADDKITIYLSTSNLVFTCPSAKLLIQERNLKK